MADQFRENICSKCREIVARKFCTQFLSSVEDFGGCPQLCSAGADCPGAYLDDDRTVLGVEVAFVINHEMAVTLIDIMHRRMMVSFHPDQGAALANKIVAIAVEAVDWDRAECDAQLGALRDYNARLRNAEV